ncbi:MAG: hypothetical protein ACE5E3_05880 [Mariprofundus sp.]
MSFLNNTLNRLAMHKQKHQADMAALTSSFGSSGNLPSIHSCDDVASQCFFGSLNTGL